MKKIFCTLFDRNYLHKGLALYFSLQREMGSDFVLWVLCMDDLTHDILSKMNLEGVKLISFNDFKTEKLLELKKERTIAEFSWTCTSGLCAYMLNTKKVEEVTYLDADMYFFSDPKEVFDEIGDSSTAIIEHRFPPERKYLEYKGKYNVSWVTFKNDVYGREAAFWWRDMVLEWCYNKYEDGKFGDQLYLDDWTTRFQNVHVIKHPRAGIAPWNISSFGSELPIFYHFHGFYMLTNGSFLPAGNYYIPKWVLNAIYKPYFKELRKAVMLVIGIQADFAYGFKRVTITDKMRRMFFKSKILERLFLYFARLRSK